MSLDKIVETESIFRKAAKKISRMARSCMATYIGYSAGGFYSLISAGAFAAGYITLQIKKKSGIALDKIIAEFGKGSIMGLIGSLFYDTIMHAVPLINPLVERTSAAYRALLNIGVGNPAYTLLYNLTDSVIEEGINFKETFKESMSHYLPDLKKVTSYLALPLALTINMPLKYGYPGIVAADYGFRVIMD